MFLILEFYKVLHLLLDFANNIKNLSLKLKIICKSGEKEAPHEWDHSYILLTFCLVGYVFEQGLFKLEKMAKLIS